MRILYLCKRQYMGHDVIVDRYARLYEQPYQLAQLGNDVLGVCLSYRDCEKKDEAHTTEQGSLRWIGLSSNPLRTSILLYPYRLLQIARDFKPDIIVGASDCLHVILGEWIAKKLKVKYAADLYDHFESFGAAKFPFIIRLFRQALVRAQVITCVSETLKEYIQQNVAPHSNAFALPSTISKSIFYPRNKQKARQHFNFSDNQILIGTAGALLQIKGIKTLYDAFLKVAKENEDVHLVLAGPTDKTCPIPEHNRIHYLGKLTHPDTANLFSALDIGIVYLIDSEYGRYSFPQKAYEIAACKTPVIAANIGDMNYLFSAQHNELYTANDHNSLANAIIGQINTPYISNLTIPDWAQQASLMLDAYKRLFIANGSDDTKQGIHQ